MAIKLHKAGYEQAEMMIEEGVEVENDASNWGEVKPDADDKLHYIDSHSLDEYGQWFLGVDSSMPPENPAKFIYPYGDFNLVQESGLIAAHDEAAKAGHDDIKAAAAVLLKMLRSSME